MLDVWNNAERASFQTVIGGVCIASITFVVMYTLYGRQHLESRLPPGPKKRFILGNLLDLPTTFVWETYYQWSKDHNSDILHASVPGNSIVILNSVSAAKDLLDKRSSNYSSRPQTVMTLELVGWSWMFGSMPYGEKWKERRRMFHRYFPAHDNVLHRQRETMFVHRLLHQGLESPANLLDLLRHMMGAIIISLSYGLPVQPSNDPYVDLAQRAMEGITETMVPGKFLVDIFPVLRYVPEYIPGAGFKRKAKEWWNLQDQFRRVPFKDGIDNIKKGTQFSSFISMAFDDLQDTGDVEKRHGVIRDTAGMFFGAGTDTTLSTLETLFLALLCNPNVQKKVQDEIDCVVGRNQLPDFEHEPHMPYLAAVIRESIRWNPALPLAIAHLSLEDDIYRDLYIPAKSVVIPNIWGMLHNEHDFPNPSQFTPERFLKDGKLTDDILNPLDIAFGFGRRSCTGKHIALSTIWLTVASILSVFDIVKVKDEKGNIIEPNQAYHDSFIYHPLPFQCKLKPRYQGAEDLIRVVSESAVD